MQLLCFYLCSYDPLCTRLKTVATNEDNVLLKKIENRKFSKIECFEYFVNLSRLDFCWVGFFNQNEAPYLVKVTEKGTAQKDLTDPYGHFIGNGKRFLKGFHLKLSRSKHMNKKKLQLLSTPVVFAPGEVFNTNVEIVEDLY